MIIVFVSWLAAMAILLMGINLGKRMEQERFDFMRQEMDLDTAQKEWEKMFKEES